MPVYDRLCSACDQKYQILEKYEEATPCPSCGSADTKRLPSAPKILKSHLARGDSATQDSIDNWDKMRRKKMEIEQRTHAEHGEYE